MSTLSNVTCPAVFGLHACFFVIQALSDTAHVVLRALMAEPVAAELAADSDDAEDTLGDTAARWRSALRR